MLETKKLNPKSAWEIIRSVLPTAKVKSSAAEDFTDKHELLDQKAIADLFTNFFCIIGKQLNVDIPKHQNNHYRNYLSKSVSKSIFLTAPTCDEIVNTIHSLNVNKAVGHDNISAYFFRIAAPNVAAYLQYFIEFRFVNGIFSENCPCAKIIPIHQKGDKTIAQFRF